MDELRELGEVLVMNKIGMGTFRPYNFNVMTEFIETVYKGCMSMGVQNL